MELVAILFVAIFCFLTFFVIILNLADTIYHLILLKRCKKKEGTKLAID